MEASEIRIACIGAGRWGANHILNLRELGALAMVVEADRQRAEQLRAELPGIPVESDLRMALGSDDIDAAVIATPVPTHFEIACACIKAGKDVLVEKPITLDADEARRLADMAEEAGRVLMTGHLLLFQPAIGFLREKLAGGMIGDVFSLHVVRRNLGRARAAENALWSLGVHDVAVILHVLGDSPVEVRATGHCGLQDGIEDSVYLNLIFANGVLAHLHNSWLWPDRDRSLLAVGSAGMLKYDEIAQHVLHIEKSIDGDLANVDNGSRVVFEGDGQPLRQELLHYIDCIRTRSQPVCDGKHAIAVMDVLESSQRQLVAAREGPRAARAAS